ncbi:MAG: DUF5989 family protein [Planctomycetaceae bacterium]
MPNILGLSSFYHDSAAAIVVDGRLVAAAQEERFSRIKADASFPQQAIESCLEVANLAIDDIDAVAFYELPLLKFNRLIETFLADAPKGFVAFRAAMPSWLTSKLRVADAVNGLFEHAPRPAFHCCPHHLSHAASAFYPSPFQTAAVLTIDGVGEWATASIARGSGSRLEPLVEQRFPHSLGLLYSAITAYCGFEINTGEYKLMGLAATGQPRWKDSLLQEIIRLAPDGSIELEQSYFDYCHGLNMTSPRFHRYVGAGPRAADEPLGELHRDLASSVQAITELAIRRMAAHACKMTGERNLCLAGGVALNCVAVGSLLDEGVVDRVWVQPAAGDAGGAVGAACWLSHHVYDVPRTCTASDGFNGAFLGPRFDLHSVERVIQNRGLVYRKLDDASICKETASLLAEGAVVGWFQGEMEFGPRALGHRSILADPRVAAMKDRVNQKIKHRETFRPFAPAVLASHVSRYFAMANADIDWPYMTRTAKVLLPETIPAVTHVDGTARLQTVDPRRNAHFANLLQAFHERTGVAVLLNTSFNDRDEPIVCTPDDAIAAFESTNLDALVLENFLILKQAVPVQPKAASAREPWSTATCLAALWRLQHRATYPLRLAGSTLALALVFYFVLTPIGMIRRLAGYRLLQQTGWLPFTYPATARPAASSPQLKSWWRELIQFLRDEKQWWLIPIAMSLAIVAVAASVGGSVAPWIYTLW